MTALTPNTSVERLLCHNNATHARKKKTDRGLDDMHHKIKIVRHTGRRLFQIKINNATEKQNKKTHTYYLTKYKPKRKISINKTAATNN